MLVSRNLQIFKRTFKIALTLWTLLVRLRPNITSVMFVELKTLISYRSNTCFIHVHIFNGHTHFWQCINSQRQQFLESERVRELTLYIYNNVYPWNRDAFYEFLNRFDFFFVSFKMSGICAIFYLVKHRRVYVRANLFIFTFNKWTACNEIK